MTKSPQLLIIGSTWPEPNATAAGGRMLTLIRTFKELYYSIIFASTAAISIHSHDLEANGVQVKSIRLNDPGFDEFLVSVQPQIVLFDRFLMEEQFGWRVAQYAPQAIRILDTEDLHSLRKTREAAFRKGEEWTLDHWLIADSTKREIASIYRCDLSLIISAYEMQLLLHTLKINPRILLYLPFMENTLPQQTIKEWPAYKARTDFLFIGTAKHAPNVDAIKWLKSEIWPLVRRRLPAANLYVCGAYFTDPILQMHNAADGFLVQTNIPDVSKMMRQIRVNLAPLRFGAGLKGKVVSAIANGTPTIATSIAAEGMFEDRYWKGAIGNNAADFADAAVSLYQNEKKWKLAQESGTMLYNEQFELTFHKKHLAEKLDSISNAFKAHRRQNFMGNLLLHQSMASTKYMSKWIEEKNKNKID